MDDKQREILAVALIFVFGLSTGTLLGRGVTAATYKRLMEEAEGKHQIELAELKIAQKKSPAERVEPERELISDLQTRMRSMGYFPPKTEDDPRPSPEEAIDELIEDVYPETDAQDETATSSDW